MSAGKIAELEQRTGKVYLSVFDAGSLANALVDASWRRGASPEQHNNCWKAIDWIRRLIEGKRQIEQVELESPKIYLREMALVAIKQGLEDVGQSILRQISEAAE